MICVIVAILVYIFRIFLKGEAAIHTGLSQADIMATNERKRRAIVTRRTKAATQSSQVEKQKDRIREKQQSFQDIIDSSSEEDEDSADVEGAGLPVGYLYGTKKDLFSSYHNEKK